MANTNTVKSLVSGSIQNTLAALSLGTSTTETTFSVNGNSTAGIASKPAVLVLPDLQTASPFVWDSGKPFLLRAWGTCTTGATTNLTLKLYQVPSSIVTAGTASTVGNDNIVATSTARAVNSTTAPFYLEAVLQWDSVGKAIKGQATFEINNLVDAYAATTAVTSITADSELNFIISATLSVGNAANVVNLREFAAENL